MRLYLSCLLLSIWIFETESFSPKNPVGASMVQAKGYHRSPIILFSDDKDAGGDSSESKKEKRRIPFFGRLSKSLKKKSGDDDNKSLPKAAEAVYVESTEPSPSIAPEDPAEIAKSLRQQAERARLEAERMDAELTLNKIEKLEGQLNVAKSKGETVEDLQLQLDNLQSKLRGEQPKPQVIAPKAPEISLNEVKQKMVEPIPQESGSIDFVFGKDFDETVQSLEDSPAFMKKLVATLVECDFDSIDDINVTDVAQRVTMMNKGDFSYSTLPKPVFTQAQLDEAIQKIEDESASNIPDSFIELAGGNVTKLAAYSLEYDYYMGSRIQTDKGAVDLIMKVGEGEEWMKPLLDVINQTAVDRSIETLYPKCMRKEGAEEPTLAQVQSLFGSVLPQAKFTSTSKPEKVLGGYVIRGSHNYESGDKLIEAIDKELSRSNLDDKMTVLLTPDFTIFAQAEEEDFDLDLFDPDEQAPILYVTAPDISRDPQRFFLSLTSAFGLATSWYLSIYPFLLNPGIAKRVEGQLELADASMAYDLNWLTDLSVPLFVSFLGIQLAHELAHRLVAASYGMKISVPTLVPSLITGTTSTVTTFKDPPPNKEALFDFAVAGPLVGLLASVVAISIGSQLTIASDPATLPSLPLEILRQSTLGGGIIDGIIKGSLYIPDGAPSAGILIPLHPLAIAGYINLVVNALSLLPVGTTDGGRIGLALFGRPAKLVVGNLFLFTLLLTGLLGSDLFLFYFSFVIAFQTGNEIACRDETENISFPRVIVAILAYCLAFLSLVPFQ